MIVRSVARFLIQQNPSSSRISSSILPIYTKCYAYSTSNKILSTTTKSNDNNNINNNDNNEYTQFGYTQIPKSDKESRVHEVFSSVAESYDTMNDLMSFGIHRYWKDVFVSMSTLQHISKCIRSRPPSIIDSTTASTFDVLDVAGGTGDIAFRLFDAAGCLERAKSSGEDPIKITICDINGNMLEVGKERARQKFGASILEESHALSFVEGNAECLPFEDNSFDLYTIAFGLRNVTNTDKALQEAYRVLKPNGRFMCLEFSHVDCSMLSSIYDMYSFYAIPTIGEVVAKDRDSYKYLVESIRTFCTQDELAQKMKSVQFQEVKYTNMTNGIVAVHEGWKV